MAFTFTSLPLNLYTSVSGCGCGIRVEQKCWWIDRFGQKKGRDQWICIPLFNPLCKQQSSNNIFILIYSTENLPNKLFLCKAGSCPINRFSSDWNNSEIPDTPFSTKLRKLQQKWIWLIIQDKCTRLHIKWWIYIELDISGSRLRYSEHYVTEFRQEINNLQYHRKF